MIDAYNERRYYKRTGDRAHPMSEQEVRDAYAIALRATEGRASLWGHHALPVKLNPHEPWLVLSNRRIGPSRGSSGWSPSSAARSSPARAL